MKLFESTPFCLAWVFIFILIAWVPAFYWQHKSNQSRRELADTLAYQTNIIIEKLAEMNGRSN